MSKIRLLIVLNWLRDYPKLTALARKYNVSTTTISRDINFILPILYTRLQLIQPPSDWNDLQVGDKGAQFIIDCTSHFRNRVHPGQRLLYRGDKHAHLLTAHIIISVDGNIIRVDIGLGHNNDPGMMYLSEFDTFIEDNNIMGLADRGYGHHLLITPNDVGEGERKEHGKYRSIVENVIGKVKTYYFASHRVRVSPELHAVGVMICYQLATLK